MPDQTNATASRTPADGGPPAKRLFLVPLIGVIAGIALGIIDFAVQKSAPYPWANLANSPAVWAVVAFAVAASVTGLSGRRFAVASCAPILAMIIAVVSYYVTAAAWQGDDLANVTSLPTALWYVAGILVGALSGIAAVWWLAGTGLRPVAGAAFPVAVLLAEALVLLRDSAPGQSGVGATAGSLVVLAVVLAAALGRSLPRVMSVVVASVPLAAIGYACYAAVGVSGFGG